MKPVLRISSLFVMGAMLVASVAEAQDQKKRREDGAGRQRQGQGQGRDRQGGGRQGGGQRRGGGPGGMRGGPGGGPGGGIDKLTLVAAKPIQEELKLGEDEIFFVNKLVEDRRAESRELFSGIDFRSLPEEERRAKFEELNKKRQELSKESEEAVSEFLTKEQSKRLDEIALQLRGVRALSDEKVATKVGLDKAQNKSIEDTFAAAAEDGRKMFEEMRSSGGDFNAMREKFEAARKAVDEKVLAVLTAEQKQKFDALKGKPFEVDRRSLFSFGGRGQGGQGRGPGGQGGQGGDRRRGGQGQRGGQDGERGDGSRPRRPDSAE